MWLQTQLSNVPKEKHGEKRDKGGTGEGEEERVEKGRGEGGEEGRVWAVGKRIKLREINSCLLISKRYLFIFILHVWRFSQHMSVHHMCTGQTKAEEGIEFPGTVVRQL